MFGFGKLGYRSSPPSRITQVDGWAYPGINQVWTLPAKETNICAKISPCGECALIDGVFVENRADIHVGLRQDLLESSAILPSLADTIPGRTSDSLDIVGDNLVTQLHEFGRVAFQFDSPLTNDQFLRLGSLLGTPIPETDIAVTPHVERQVILNIVSQYPQTQNVCLQPFATNFLTLHSESSSRRTEDQPRFIVFMCCDPGEDSMAAQTVFVPMETVYRQLTSRNVAVLSQTKYRQSQHGPPILRRLGCRHVFSFRDFLSQTLEWTHYGDETSATGINTDIRNLLASMYAPEAALGVRWTRGMLVIIDNTFFFHGRKAGSVGTSIRRRHLKRLRILNTR